MKKMMALIALAGMIFVGCAHKNTGGSSDENMSGSSTGTSNPPRTYSSDTNNLQSNPSTDGSKPQQQ